MILNKFLFSLFIFTLTWNVGAKSACELEYLIGPPSDPYAFVHTQKALATDFDPRQIKSLQKAASLTRTAPLVPGHNTVLKEELIQKLKVANLDAAVRLELDTALSLVQDPHIGKTVRGYNVEILHPVPWEYLPSESLRGGLAVFRERGYHVRKFYELDIELECCIVEITFSKKIENVLYFKKRQLKRMVNKEGTTNFINPNNKKVILFTPNITAQNETFAQMGVVHTRSRAQLISEIKRSISASTIR